MRTVRDQSGRRYLLLKESEETSLVRDPATGEETYRPNDDLDPVPDTAPLEAATEGIPEPVRQVLIATHNEQALGVLVEVVDRGALSVRALLAETTLCESDLHGTLAELVAAELLVETTVAGERGYEPTDSTEQAIDILRGKASREDG